MMLLANPAFAQTSSNASGALMNFLPLILIFVIMYFLLIRPQQKKQKEHRMMVEAVKRGDKIITAGGIVGKVTKVKDENEVEVEIAKDVTIKLVKSTITSVISKTKPAG